MTSVNTPPHFGVDDERLGRSFFLLLALVAALLGYRVTVGIDLSDEAYYISFVDGWLKTGLGASNTLGIHQTAALLLYPLVKLFVFFNGGVEGLALFLRILYLAASGSAAIFIYALAREFRGRATGILATALLISFIPFSLPSASYNTIGMQAMICALGSCGVHFVRTTSDVPSVRHARGGWAAASASAWTVAAVAYPTLLAVQGILIVLLFAQPTFGRNRALRYAILCIALQVVAAAILLGIYGLERLLEMLQFTNASLQVSSGFISKIGRLSAPLIQHPSFAVLCAVCFGFGLIIPRARNSVFGGWLLTAGLLSALALATYLGPALYARTHDLVLLLSVLGFGMLLTRRPVRTRSSDQPHHALINLLIMVGLCAGVVTSITATNGLVNFAVGGFFCALLALVIALPGGPRHQRAHATLLAGTCGLFLWGAFSFIYGEMQNPLMRDVTSRRMNKGIFAGLLTNSNQADSIDATAALLKQIEDPNKGIAIFGRLPGIYLLTTMKPMTLSTWDFDQHNQPLPRIAELRSRFYEETAHRPDFVLVISDPWTKPPSMDGQKLLLSYRLCRKLSTKNWEATLFIKGSSSSPDSTCEAHS